MAPIDRSSAIPAMPVTDSLVDHFTLNPFIQHTLANGIEVFAFPGSDEDIMRLTFVFNAGHLAESSRGIALVTHNLIADSLQHHFAEAPRADARAVHVTDECDLAFSKFTFSLSSSKRLVALLPTLRSQLMKAKFTQKSLNDYINAALEKLNEKAELDLAQMVSANIYGPRHIYFKTLSTQDLDAIQYDDVSTFYKKQYLRGGLKIFITGNLTVAIIQGFDNTFGRLDLAPDANGIPSLIDLPKPQPAKTSHIDKYNYWRGFQDICFAKAFTMTNKMDYWRATFINHILGVGESSLLSKLKDECFYFDSMDSQLITYHQHALLLITAQSSNILSPQALKDIYGQLERLSTTPITEDLLKLAKKSFLLNLIHQLDGRPFKQAEFWEFMILEGRDKDFLKKGVRLVRTITPTQIHNFVRKHLQPSGFHRCTLS